MRMLLKIGAGLSAAALLVGCGDPSLMNLRNTESGPDEFAVLPSEPIEIPSDLASLPTPTPGGINRTDPNPEADAIAALGGNVERATRNAGDIVTYASRLGVAPEIRGVLASEDAEFRDRNQGLILERLAGVNVYYSAYDEMSLDQYNELERLRRAGVRTPSAPPEDIELND